MIPPAGDPLLPVIDASGGLSGHYAAMASPRRERIMLAGAGVTMVGGLLLVGAGLATLPGAIALLGLVLFVAGLVVIGAAGGLRGAWDAFKAFVP